jgi:hypothetical protein
MTNGRSRLSRIGTLISQFLNVVLLDGSPDESVSGRAAREGWHRAERIINAIFFWERDHCASAHRDDIAFARAILHIQDEAAR